MISNNLANGTTPGFKAKEVSFSQVLGKAKQTNNASNPQNRPNGASFRTTVTTQENTSVRVDGNNVQLEKEQAELWKTQAQYSYLMDRIGGHFNSINSAISNMRG